MKQWGPLGYAQQIDRAMAEAKRNNTSVERELWEIGAACRAVHAVINWPDYRISELRARTVRPRRNPRARGGY